MTSDEELKKKLIKQMGSLHYAEALQAVKELRERGWLDDGSLWGAELRRANLHKADLSKVNLSGTYLSDANLHRADLRGANLHRAILGKANLSRANLGKAVLFEAFLFEADLRGANLGKANLSDAVLPEANLSGAILIGADLGDANLSRANLHEADLRSTYLSDANLSETDLTGAVLGGAILGKANLTGANLSGASLSGANLRDTFLPDADFTEAKCDLTVFADVDLSAVKGLETVKHFGPSTIGIDTIYKSKGQIPDVFLRGCGVPENLVAYHRSLVGQAIDFYPAFISYSHEDLACAQRIHDTLQGQGIRCWLDIHQVKPGHHIWDEIERGIRLWDKTILCCSEHSLTSDWVENELENLFAKERRIRERLRKQQGTDPGPVRLLIPLDLDGFVFSEEFKSGMKQHIISRHVADFTNWKQDSDKFDEKMKEVVAFLRPDEGREPPPPSLIAR